MTHYHIIMSDFARHVVRTEKYRVSRKAGKRIDLLKSSYIYSIIE